MELLSDIEQGLKVNDEPVLTHPREKLSNKGISNPVIRINTAAF